MPAYADVVKHVVAAHTWSTSALLLLGTDTQQRALELPHAIYAYGTAWAGLQVTITCILALGRWRVIDSIPVACQSYCYATSR